jgi:uncharacterized membrane protein
MLGKLGFALGLIAVLIGLILLYSGVLKGDPAQSMLLIVGAALFSLGLVVVYLTAKSWWHWKRGFKGDDR